VVAAKRLRLLNRKKARKERNIKARFQQISSPFFFLNRANKTNEADRN
jgi:hypothetical protein